MDHHVFVRVGEKKKFARREAAPESLRGCLLLVLCRRGSPFRIARFHGTIVARDEQPAILLAASVPA